MVVVVMILEAILSWKTRIARFVVFIDGLNNVIFLESVSKIVKM